MNKLIALFAIVLAVGCVDSDDDDCNVDSGVACEDVREDSRIPRDAKILPYKPAVVESALLLAPGAVYTSGVLAPHAVTNPEIWSIRTGGFNKWNKKSTLPGNEGVYRTSLTYATLGRPLPGGVTCTLVGSYSNGYMVCAGATYKCPSAQPVKPIAYSFGTEAPDYSLDAKYRITLYSVVPYAQFYRTSDSFRCDYSLSTAELRMVSR